MDVWSEQMAETGGRGSVFGALTARGWLNRLMRRRGDEATPAASGIQEEWHRRIQLLSEECDNLRRKMQIPA